MGVRLLPYKAVLIIAIFLLVSFSFVSANRRPTGMIVGGGGGGEIDTCDSSALICSSAACGDQWLSSGEANGSGSFADFFDWQNLFYANPNPAAVDPTGIGVDNSGNVFFVSRAKHVLYKCDKDLLNCSIVFGEYEVSGNNSSHLSFSEGMAIDKWNNTILVADSGNNRVLRLKNEPNNYTFLDSLSINAVKDVSSDSKGNVFFVAGSKVFKHNNSLDSQLAFFDFASFPGYDASRPLQGVSTGNDNLLYGADSVLVAGNGLNKVFQLNNDLNGIIREFGTMSASQNGLHFPTGVDFDWSGNKFVAEFAGNRLTKFNPEMNSKLKSLGTYDQCVSPWCGTFKVDASPYGLYATNRNSDKVVLLKRNASCCGNNVNENPVTFASVAGACDETGTCNQTSSNNKACCNTSAGECVFNSQCFSAGEIENIDYLQNINPSIRNARYAVCDYGWKDGDYSRNACAKIDAKLSIKNCSGEECWLAEGETSSIGEFGDSFGGEGEGSGIFDKYQSYNVQNNAITECCGDDSLEYVVRNGSNPADAACCNNPNDIVVNGQCVSPTQTINESLCGEVFGECNAIGQRIFCGDSQDEFLKEFDSFLGACNSPEGCSASLIPENACCNNSSDCVFQGACYSSGTIANIDGSSQNPSYAMCNGAKWYDADISYDTCTLTDQQFNLPNCSGTDCWTSEGEFSPFGEFGDDLGGEYNPLSPPEYSSGIYDFMTEYNVNEHALQECCGDDSGEFYKTNATEKACCSSAYDTVVGGECVPENLGIRNEFFLKRCVNEQNLSYCAKISNANKKNISYLQYAVQHNNSSVCNSISGNAAMQNYCIQKVQLFQTQGALIDTVYPAASITSPSGGVSCHPYTLTGSATDNFGPTGVSYSITWGSILTDQQGNLDYGNYSKALQLSPGGNTIKVTISDNAGNSVQASKTVFCPNILTLDQTWSGFSFLSGVATDNAGNVYVSEKNNYRILKLNPGNGAVLQTYNLVGHTAPDNGIQLRPLGLDVDSSGNIYFAFEFAGGIQVQNSLGGVYKISPSGGFLQQFGSYNSSQTNKFMWNPKDVDVVKRTDGASPYVIAIDDDVQGNDNLLAFFLGSSSYVTPITETTGGSNYAAGIDNYIGHFFYANVWSNDRIFYRGIQSLVPYGPGEFGTFTYSPAGMEIDVFNNLLTVADGISESNMIHFYNATTRQLLAKQRVTNAVGLNYGLAIFGDYLYYVEQPTGKVFKYSINRGALQ